MDERRATHDDLDLIRELVLMIEHLAARGNG
jgi:hypothetical protein